VGRLDDSEIFSISVLLILEFQLSLSLFLCLRRTQKEKGRFNVLFKCFWRELFGSGLIVLPKVGTKCRLHVAGAPARDLVESKVLAKMQPST